MVSCSRPDSSPRPRSPGASGAFYVSWANTRAIRAELFLFRTVGLKLDEALFDFLPPLLFACALSGATVAFGVGPQGVFAIETKARMRRWKCKDQPAHVVRFDEKTLHFPWRGNTKFVDRETIPQAERNARWLANYLTKKTGERVAVEPLVVIPGWWVERLDKPRARQKVMNALYLAGYLRRQPEKLPPPQVRRIIAAR